MNSRGLNGRISRTVLSLAPCHAVQPSVSGNRPSSCTDTGSRHGPEPSASSTSRTGADSIRADRKTTSLHDTADRAPQRCPGRCLHLSVCDGPQDSLFLYSGSWFILLLQLRFPWEADRPTLVLSRLWAQARPTSTAENGKKVPISWKVEANCRSHLSNPLLGRFANAAASGSS